MNPESIRQFFRDNPRAWLVAAAAVLTLVLAVWGIWGGFSLEFSRFFAVIDSDPGDGTGGGPSPTCTLSGTTCNGTKIWNHYIDCGTSSAGEDCAASGKVCKTNNGSPSVIGATCEGSGGAPVPTGSGPVDPSGACVFKTNFNAPEGGWFCNPPGGFPNQCQLDGNPSGGQEYPPAGPASRLAIKIMGESNEAVEPANGPIHIRTKLDATPKTSGGKEGYPPNDPLWSCTAAPGVMDLGRNGHDKYDCYNPIIHRWNYGPITCCANTGLAGDCFTWNVEGGPGGPVTSVAPSGSPAPTPTPVYPPLTCAPIEQTVALKQNATVTAAGGSGTYQWALSGSGVQQGGGANSVVVSYTVSGQKVVRVSSGGQTATCVVTVTPAGGGSEVSPISVFKRGINASTGAGGETSAITLNPNQIAQFRVSITNNGTTAVSGLRVTDTLPTGMSYRYGSTTIDGQVVSVDTITTSGLMLDSMEPGSNMNVQWSAIADMTGQLAAGPHQSQPQVVVSGNDIADATADMTVTVYSSGATVNTGGITGAGGQNTGPGDAVTIALIVAAALTLLYSGYTRSPAYRRHDADVVSRDQGPMDFRS